MLGLLMNSAVYQQKRNSVGFWLTMQKNNKYIQFSYKTLFNGQKLIDN